jgi:formylmethanofuran dehydrogenase subunit C
MALELTLRAPSSLPIEVEGLLPEAVREKTLAEIERWPIFCGNEQVPLAELFHARGAADDCRISFQGDMSRVHWIGAHLAAGAIHIAGSAGRHVGSQMTGGEITVEGDASDSLGAEMHGGLIRVSGRTGKRVGAAYLGSPRGMTGGLILVGGDAGDEVAHTMRRGLIAIGGTVGDFAAINMIAGSVLVWGGCGIRPAAGMQRGTLAVLGGQPTLLPTFRAAGPCQPVFLRVYLRELTRLGFPLPDELASATYELFHGDMLTGGRGEILLRK